MSVTTNLLGRLRFFIRVSRKRPDDSAIILTETDTDTGSGLLVSIFLAIGQHAYFICFFTFSSTSSLPLKAIQ